MTTVRELNADECRVFEQRIRDEGQFEFKALPYGFFQAKGEGVSVALYKSGKCVIQGKGEEQFLARYFPGALEEQADQILKKETSPEHTELAVGSDESGKGDFFGPLVICAVAYGPEYRDHFEGIDLGDSKKLTANTIRRNAERIRETLPHAVVVIRPPKYNELYRKIANLNRLLAWGHGAALEGALEKADAPRIIVDKFCEERVLRPYFKEKTKSKELILRTRAESHPAVGAASILASDVFTRELARLSREMDLTLPKGAGSQVDATARRLVKAQGPAVLERCAKVHFKTTQKVLGG